MKFELFSRTDYLSQQRRLFEECFPETRGTATASLESYYWKFSSTAVRSVEFGAFFDQAIVGYYAALNYSYWFAGERYSAALICDVMTANSMRGKGVFARLGAHALGELKETGFDFAIGYPIRPEVIPGHLKVGWDIAFDLPIYVKVIRIDDLVRGKLFRFLTRLGNLVASAVTAITEARYDPRYSVKTCTLAELLKRPDYNQFIQQWSSSVGVCLDKSAEFMKWRFGAPEAHYLIVTAETAGELAAVSILRETILKGVSTLAIIDFMVAPDHDGAGDSIHRLMVEIARSRDINLISGMFSGPTATILRLRRRGFLKSPYIFKLILRKLRRPVPAQFYDAASWHLSWIDTDNL